MRAAVLLKLFRYGSASRLAQWRCSASQAGYFQCAQQAPFVEPGPLCERGIFERVNAPLWSPALDQLGFVEIVELFGLPSGVRYISSTGLGRIQAVALVGEAAAMDRAAIMNVPLQTIQNEVGIRCRPDG